MHTLYQNYFYRRDKHELDKRKEKEQKRLQLKQAATAQQAALAAANIYANTYPPHASGLAGLSGAAFLPQGVPIAHPGMPVVNAPGFALNGVSSSVLYGASSGNDVGLSLEPASMSSNAPPFGASSNVPVALDSFPGYVPPVVAAPLSAAAASATASKSEAEPEVEAAHPAEVEDEEEEEDVLEPEIDEKQMAYSTMEGVKLLTQPTILKAELHEHQVRISCFWLSLSSDLEYALLVTVIDPYLLQSSCRFKASVGWCTCSRTACP